MPLDSCDHIEPDVGLLRAFINGITPPPLRGLAEWAETEYYLPPETAAEPGLINLKRTPYQYGICEAVDDPKVQTVSMMMSAQLAKTTVILAMLGQIASTPGMGAPILVVMPIEDNAEMLSRERFAPMIESSPTLKKALVDNKKAGAGNKVMQKFFSNGTIINFVGSNTPAKLASRPVKYLLADEVDRFARSAGEEGSPLELAKKRLSTFEGNGAKEIITSTPTLKGLSEIERHWNSSDQRFYRCECPHCQDRHTLEFENVFTTTELGDTYRVKDHASTEGAGELDWKRAYYACPACGAEWSEADRLAAIDAGYWEITRPQIDDHAGFHANAMISPWVGQWHKGARKFIEAIGAPELERVFVNTYLGIPYTSDDLAVDEKTLIERMEPLTLDMVDARVLAMTGGADVQVDRIELMTIGHSKHQSFILAHEIIYGDTTGSQVWADLEEAISRRFEHELGNSIGYDAVAVDAGYLTGKVAAFAAKPRKVNVYSTIGRANERPLWELSKQKRKNTDEKLFIVGVDDGKTILMERLKIADPNGAGYIHIANHGAYNAEFSKQLIAEYRDIEFKGGRPKIVWKPKSGSHRSEVMDCFVYGLACFGTLKPAWDDRQRRLTKTESSNSKRGWATFD